MPDIMSEGTAEYKITGHFPCISLRWPTQISSRTHSNIQMANQIHYRHDKMADQFCTLDHALYVRTLILFSCSLPTHQAVRRWEGGRRRKGNWRRMA